MSNKSYWQSIYIGSDDAKAIVKSRFAPLCEGMTPYKAEILCDVEADKEKKLRAFMVDAENKHYKFERTLGRQTFSISRKPVTAAHPASHASTEVDRG